MGTRKVFNVVIAEGFKGSIVPKLRLQEDSSAVHVEENVVAIMTDEIASESRAIKVVGEPCNSSTFRCNEMYELATYLRDRFL